VTGIHADIDAMRGLHEALVRYRHAQREVASRGDDAIMVARASLEARASRWQTQLELCQAEFGACRGTRPRRTGATAWPASSRAAT
jgi:hypothetical protein